MRAENRQAFKLVEVFKTQLIEKTSSGILARNKWAALEPRLGTNDEFVPERGEVVYKIRRDKVEDDLVYDA